MNQLKYFLLLILLIVSSVNMFSLDRIIKVTDIIYDIDKNLEDTLLEEFDSNKDGNVDYLIQTSFDGDKIIELIDFNHDGDMDDIYFYTNGIIVRREIDSNFDLNIDIWVYIKEGSMIEKYEQDLDFNGNIDKVKLFGGEEQS